MEVDNLNVVRHVGRPVELVNDGDHLLLNDRMLQRRGLDTVRITKVKEHADHGMGLDGPVREQDRVENNAADEAADLGRRRVDHSFIDARLCLSGVCGRWYPVLLSLHRFFFSMILAVVNHDGSDGTAPDPLVRSAGPLPRRRRLVHAVRDQCHVAWTLPLFGLLGGSMFGLSAVSAEDVAHWPYSVSVLVKWVTFLSSLHWPVGGADLGVGGVSYVEMLILFELWAG